jgi:uncharacterized protein YndB with AHSA1/START domain
MSETLQPADELSLEFSIDEAPQKVWHALTEPAVVEQWLAPIRGNNPPAQGSCCEVLSTDPGHSVSYRWRDPEAGESIVTFAVSEREDGFSRLSIRQEGLPATSVVMSGALGCSLAITATKSPRRALDAANHACPPILRAA